MTGALAFVVLIIVASFLHIKMQQQYEGYEILQDVGIFFQKFSIEYMDLVWLVRNIEWLNSGYVTKEWMSNFHTEDELHDKWLLRRLEEFDIYADL